MDTITALLGPPAAALFLVGLVLLMAGLPFFIWLAVRACRDLHRIAGALERLASTATDPLAGKVDRIAREIAGAPGAVLSAFGR